MPEAHHRRGAVRFVHRPALDGVRAVAVAAVLVFHGGLTFLPGGFFGVDAFFVLSGFLITSLLLVEWGTTRHIRLPVFWARRARRLLPALLLMLAAVAVAARWLLPPGDLAPVRNDSLAALLYVANWRMIFRGSDYFAQTAAPSPLQHTWSLGIEEQFYLLWPLIVVAVLAWRRRYERRRGRSGDHRAVTEGATGRSGRRGLLIVCVVGGLISTALEYLLYHPTDANRAYFGTDSRAVALLVGCAMSVLLIRRLTDPAVTARAERRWHPALGAATVAAVLFLGWAGTHATGSTRWQYHGGFTLVALAVAVVIAHAALSPRSPTAWVLSRWPLVALGRISYGVYLWHWPVFMFLTAARSGLAGLPLFTARCAVTLVIAALSYHLVEQPIRQGKLLRRGSRLAPAGALSAMAVVAVLSVFATTAPLLSSGGLAGPGDHGGRPVVVHSHSPRAVAPVNRPGRRPGKEPRITLFGDSVSWSLGTYLPPHPGLKITVRSIEGCGIATLPDILELDSPHTNYPGCTRWPHRWRTGARKDDPDVAVILLDRWELMSRRLHGHYRHVGQPDYDRYLAGQLNTAIDAAGSHGAKVVLLTAPYTHRAEKPDGGLYGEDQPQRVDAWNRLLRDVAHRRHLTVLDLNAVVCPDGHFTWKVEGVQVRSDGLHFTPDGVQQIIAPWLLPKLGDLATGN